MPRKRGPFVRAHTATALNFQLTMLIAYLVVLTHLAGKGSVHPDARAGVLEGA